MYLLNIIYESSIILVPGNTVVSKTQNTEWSSRGNRHRSNNNSNKYKITTVPVFSMNKHQWCRTAYTRRNATEARNTLGLDFQVLSLKLKHVHLSTGHTRLLPVTWYTGFPSPSSLQGKYVCDIASLTKGGDYSLCNCQSEALQTEAWYANEPDTQMQLVCIWFSFVI